MYWLFQELKDYLIEKQLKHLLKKSSDGEFLSETERIQVTRETADMMAAKYGNYPKSQQYDAVASAVNYVFPQWSTVCLHGIFRFLYFIFSCFYTFQEKINRSLSNRMRNIRFIDKKKLKETKANKRQCQRKNDEEIPPEQHEQNVDSYYDNLIDYRSDGAFSDDADICIENEEENVKEYTFFNSTRNESKN